MLPTCPLMMSPRSLLSSLASSCKPPTVSTRSSTAARRFGVEPGSSMFPHVLATVSKLTAYTVAVGILPATTV
nr:unnamed protein product [Digitaria exilis]